MFRDTAPVTEPAHDVDVMMDPADELVPLSVLALDLDAPAVGWDAFLASRNIPVVLDHIGRSAISSADARQLLDEQREAEAHAQEVAAQREREAVERDRQSRAQLNGGVPWYALPPGVSAPEAWAQAEKDARPKRRTLLEDALAREEGTMVYHSLRDGEGES
jgi:hypothetical protein